MGDEVLDELLGWDLVEDAGEVELGREEIVMVLDIDFVNLLLTNVQ